MKFIHISDIHYRLNYPSVASSYKAFLTSLSDPLNHLKDIAKIAKNEAVDGILITGDLVDDGTREDYELLKNYFNSYFKDFLIIMGPGNHDDIPTFQSVLFNGTMTHKTHLHQRHELEDFIIVYFDNTYNKSYTGAIEDSQYNWLEKTLNNANKPVLLLTHHHLIKTQAQIPSVKTTHPIESLIDRSNIIGILCGHTHHAYQSTYGNKMYSTGPSLSFRGIKDPQGNIQFEEHPGYQIITISDQKMTISTHYLYAKAKPLSPPK